MAEIREAIRHIPWMPKALWLLAIARLELRTVTPINIRDENERLAGLAWSASTLPLPSQHHAIDRVSYLIPRIAHRLPWRADCLVQALAGQRWLSDKGIASKIEIGISQTEKDGFRAHAWLNCKNQIILGGITDTYSALLTDKEEPNYPA